MLSRVAKLGSLKIPYKIILGIRALSEVANLSISFFQYITFWFGHVDIRRLRISSSDHTWNLLLKAWWSDQRKDRIFRLSVLRILKNVLDICLYCVDVVFQVWRTMTDAYSSLDLIDPQNRANNDFDGLRNKEQYRSVELSFIFIRIINGSRSNLETHLAQAWMGHKILRYRCKWHLSALTGILLAFWINTNRLVAVDLHGIKPCWCIETYDATIEVGL